MKKIVFILGILALTACSSTRLVDSWKNKEIAVFRPQKLLVIGMTENLTARKIFEEKLKEQFINRGINAYESSMALDQSFTASKRSEEDIEMMKEELLQQGFDAIVITAVVGIDDKTIRRSGHYTFGYNWWYRFGPYFYRFQDIYYTPDYYEDYKVFHIETSIYNISSDEDESLVWVGTFNIVDPVNITSTVNDYVARIIGQLERENLIEKL
ncbi:hypothetical protein SAMN04488008_104373 [Maribacter orientalis]|uniref:DUF4136 domain-containing protein n=1 Tax=Maribacter orientalis TaxID=228957 RepID=A0A1H7RTL7_9FLAO|nr:hypothetical protein [Maribacter orientalis]SEL62757.1 hypothetical protein SAMN04488008_104373 [Maribacter orientalis]